MNVNLPTVPLIDATEGGSVAILDAAPEKLDAIVAQARRHYTPPVLGLGDRLSRAWLARGGNPYAGEIDAIAAALGVPAAHLLNLSFEWSCTTGVAPSADGTGNRMRRTLDWRLPGLGRNLVVARRRGAAGDYFDITWPGFVGITTAMAPGRFAAAINQPPMRKYSPLFALDWLINRGRVARSRALPPAHLLRCVFDACANFAEARAMLAETPICLPVFFTLSGTTPDEGCVIERTESAAAVRDGPVCAANHWVTMPIDGWGRGIASRDRLDAMTAVLATDAPWPAPPVLNETTRLAVEADARAGTLAVRGHESDGPVTDWLRI